MIVTKTHTNFKIDESKPFSVSDTDVPKKMKDKNWKVSIVDESGFGMAIYLNIHDMLIVNGTVAKLVKEYYLEEHVSSAAEGNGEEKTE